MKSLLTAILLAGILSPVCASAQYQFPAGAKKKGAVIVVQGGEVFTFGKIPSGPEVKHQFIVTNTGDEPLVIKDVLNNCSYATSEWTREPIMPGKKGVIIEYLNTTAWGGTFNNYLYVCSNAANNNSALGYFLSVAGDIDRKDDY